MTKLYQPLLLGFIVIILMPKFVFSQSPQKKHSFVSYSYITFAEYDKAGKKLKWGKSNQIKNVNTNLTLKSDRFLFNYGLKSGADTFVKTELTAEESRKIVKDIHGFKFVGCFDKLKPDRAYYLFYMNADGDILSQLYTMLGDPLSILRYGNKSENPLENVTPIGEYIHGSVTPIKLNIK